MRGIAAVAVVVLAVFAALAVAQTDEPPRAAPLPRLNEELLVNTLTAARDLKRVYPQYASKYSAKNSQARDTINACRKEMKEEYDWTADKFASRVSAKLAETEVLEFQLKNQYEQCDIGRYYSAIREYMSHNDTCLADHYTKRELQISVKLIEGNPKVKFACKSPACYSCLATLGCELDSLAKAVTLGRIDPEAIQHPLTEARTYAGDHQLEFDGKHEFVSLPQFGQFTNEFTFEASVAWMPNFDHKTNGATVKIFDFFAEDPQRAKAYEDSEREFAERHAKLKKLDKNGLRAYQKEMSQKRKEAEVQYAKAMKEREAERAREAREREAAKRYEKPYNALDNLNVQQAPSIAAPGPMGMLEEVLLSEPGKESIGLDHDKKLPGPATLPHVTAISFSPGQYIPPSEAADNAANPPMGMRLTIDRAEVMCQKSMEQNAWQHLAITVHRRGSSHDEDCCWSVAIYLDTVLACEQKFPLSEISLDRIIFMVNSNFLGRDQDGSADGYFKGYMDGVRLWRTARTMAELRASQHRAVLPDAPGLIANYRFDELRTSTRVIDRSANQLNGWLGTMEKSDLETCPKRVTIRPEAMPEMHA